MLTIAGGILIAVAALFVLYVAFAIFSGVISFAFSVISDLFESRKTPDYYRLKGPIDSEKPNSKWD